MVRHAQPPSRGRGMLLTKLIVSGGLVDTQITLNGLDRPSQWRTDRLKGQAIKRLGPQSEPYLETEPKHWVNTHPINGIDHLVNSLPSSSVGEHVLSLFFETRRDPIQNEEEARDVCLAYVPDWVYFFSARFLGNLGVVVFLGVPIVIGSLDLLSDGVWSMLVMLLLIFVNEYMRATMRNPAIGLALVIAFASALAGNARSG
ncbi:hypothetical protein B0I35DRAFT_243922 [Stachybotrys elegans]|uniref:Uncharacterized protein n=1 Tax=Stachybotrys elegans TaxID=80388 RepID=A0A8K0SQ29_9HYPO|nr:hypothetical protein B0I35DRAFT_243922 [Stachybotrys elegans]